MLTNEFGVCATPPVLIDASILQAGHSTEAQDVANEFYQDGCLGLTSCKTV